MVSFIYFVIKAFEVFVFYKSGYFMENKTGRAYWKIALVPIILFALIEGLRWGHDIDYNVYAYRFTLVNFWFTYDERSSPLFSIIVYGLKLLGGNYPLFLVIESGFLMFSAFVLLQLYKEHARWIAPCFLIAFLPNENFIRFYFALAFVICSFYCFFEKKYIWCALLLLAGASMHFAMFVVAVLFALFPILDRRMIDIRVVLIFLIIASFFISVTSLNFIVVVSNKLSMLFRSSNSIAVSYLGGMDNIISGDHGTMGLMHSSAMNVAKQFFTYVPLFLWGSKVINQYKYGKFVHNVSALNVLISPIFSQVEILSRMTLICNVFIAIYMGIFMGEYFRKSTSRIKLIFVFFAMFCYFYAYINAPFVREDFQMFFLWNSNGSIANWAPYHN